jgi:hypothetical protein
VGLHHSRLKAYQTIVAGRDVKNFAQARQRDEEAARHIEADAAEKQNAVTKEIVTAL